MTNFTETDLLDALSWVIKKRMPAIADEVKSLKQDPIRKVHGIESVLKELNHVEVMASFIAEHEPGADNRASAKEILATIGRYREALETADRLQEYHSKLLDLLDDMDDGYDI